MDEALKLREVDQKINENPYVLTTIHRRENTDNRERLKEILAGLSALPIKSQ